jgi:hypothetical protein
MSPTSPTNSDPDPDILDKVQNKDQPPSDATSEGKPDEQPARSEPLEARADVGAAGREATAGLRIPLPASLMPNGADAKRLLWFGGLGALAVVGVLEWPVALAVGAGTVVAERLAREQRPPAATASPTTPETTSTP